MELVEGEVYSETQVLKEYFPSSLNRFSKYKSKKNMSIFCRDVSGSPAGLIVWEKFNIIFNDTSNVHFVCVGGSVATKESNNYFNLDPYPKLRLFIKFQTDKIRYIGFFHVLGRAKDKESKKQFQYLIKEMKSDYKLKCVLTLVRTKDLEQHICKKFG